MNPYVTDPNKIPPSDLYSDLPCFGRYGPKPDDFHIDRQHVNSHSTESLQYWASVLDLCTESVMIYPGFDGARGVFALGSVIIKSSHLHRQQDTKYIEKDYTYADANEIQAIAIAKTVLQGVRVPEIYFSGKIYGLQVLIQERLPGVALTVAWPYLSGAQQESFRQQARHLLRQMHSVKPTDGREYRSHVVSDPHIRRNGRLAPLEYDTLFSDANTDPDMRFMHNDFCTSNCIVDNDKIVGLIDWEMAGFFGWKTARQVHRNSRPSLESFWKDLYEDEEADLEGLKQIPPGYQEWWVYQRKARDVVESGLHTPKPCIIVA